MNKLLTLTALAAALTLAGCGGSDSYDAGTPTTPPPTSPPPTTPPPPPVSMVDAFFSAVMALIGDGQETTGEPVATDSITVTQPADTEPVALK